MAELPTAKRERYLSLGLPKADVLILADELATADFFDATMAAGAQAKAAANWIMGDIMAACKVSCRPVVLSTVLHGSCDRAVMNGAAWSRQPRSF
jgi:Asp-tRNA(Asn)/Glu-tRNA(Gln) amidotransferase B subunit